MKDGYPHHEQSYPVHGAARRGWLSWGNVVMNVAGVLVMDMKPLK